MAGSISLSLSQQFDELGEPLNGGKLYFFAAGTTDPQIAYQDVALTLPWPWPIVLDSAGRIPPFYLADGQIKIRLANAAGVTQVAADNLLVTGASSGAGSPPSVDATTVLGTGDLKARYGTGAHTGWVRANGRTLGSAASGASERANSDCQDLFEYLWGADANLTVSTGRGASANADWTANKTIVLPDWRGRVIAGLDDMGNSAAGRLTVSYFGATATVLGAAAGSESHALTEAQLAVHDHNITDPGHTHVEKGSPAGGASNHIFKPDNGTSGVVADSDDSTKSATTGISINNAGSGDAHNNTQPTMLATIYIKL
jgi:microcystin-dependent protein